MGRSTRPRPNPAGTGNINCYNQTNSNNNTINNITQVTKQTKSLKWLSPLQPGARHGEVRARRQDGPGERFLKSDGFLRWRDDKGEPGKATLFCSGNPGVGKTLLSSLVIDKLREHTEGKNITVAYLYCDFQDQERQTTANMIGALTRQLVEALKMIPTEIEEALKSAKSEVEGEGLQVGEIVKILQAALAPVRQAFICIDALDECPGVRLFFTGRFYIRTQVEKCLPGGVQIIPISPNSEDIREYLEVELEHDPDPEAMNPALKADILKRIPEKIPDAFLLVSLSIAAILGEATIHKRRERLDIMTSGLGWYGTYDATLDRIKGQGQGKSALGMAALMWISRTERPMHIEELREALGVEIGSRDVECDNIPSEKTVLASCLGLITIDTNSIVRLVHSTLQEHLRSNSEHFENPQSTMAEICLTYLNFDSVNKLSHTLESAPAEPCFLKYASCYWGLYARNGLTKDVKSLALQLLRKFGGHISAKLLLRESFGAREEGVWHSEGFTGLHCAAYLGLDKVAITLLGRGCDADIADTWSRTPLIWAARSGHEGMVKLLLDRKKVNPDQRDNFKRTPLSYAASGGHEGTVKMLLDREEVDPDSRDEDGRTPLLYATRGGHKGIVKLLLAQKEVNPDSKDNNGQTPLLCAARGGHEGIVKVLLCQKKKVNPDLRDKFNRTPLSYAAQGGHEGIVKVLLERKKVNPDSSDKYNRTSLSYAAGGGHEEIVKLLLGQKKKVNPDQRDNFKRTPLSYAASGGHEKTVKMLLGQEEVNPDSRDRFNRTPLSYAAPAGHDGTVKMLLDREEVDPDSRDNFNRTPLSYAAPGGHEGTVKILLNRKEVDPDSRDNFNRTPLSYAASGGHEGTVKTLLDREEVDPDSRDKDDRTPLSYATPAGHEGIVKMLLDREGVNPDFQDDDGGAPLL